ncbi:membrane protein [Pedobacter sp. BMA]|uniref:DoxX family protein n=1 Tax=Pedobacter sp. BMA TaxID=1663685 RepID=UPI000649B6C9|nr:membrane protein [Pedobacter sp. BMA]KLT63772.1 membrane protein [Pedobacter sp. BMA]
MKTSLIKNTTRILLGTGLVFAGIGHLTFARKPFQAQVPDWVPLKKDDTVVYSGFVEIAMGTSLIFAPVKYQKFVGLAAASLFVAVFPGNVSQYLNKRSAFGLNTDQKRFARLFFQPILVFWALASTSKKT